MAISTAQVEAAVTTILSGHSRPEERRAADQFLTAIAASPQGCEVAFSVRAVAVAAVVVVVARARALRPSPPSSSLARRPRRRLDARARAAASRAAYISHRARPR